MTTPLLRCRLRSARWRSSLATAEATSRVSGDSNGDSHDDLAVGVPFQDVGSIGNAGAVNVLYGSASRLTATGNQLWRQDSTGIVDAAEPGDQFGSSLPT